MSGNSGSKFSGNIDSADNLKEFDCRIFDVPEKGSIMLGVLCIVEGDLMSLAVQCTLESSIYHICYAKVGVEFN